MKGWEEEGKIFVNKGFRGNVVTVDEVNKNDVKVKSDRSYVTISLLLSR